MYRGEGGGAFGMIGLRQSIVFCGFIADGNRHQLSSLGVIGGSICVLTVRSKAWTLYDKLVILTVGSLWNETQKSIMEQTPQER